MSKKIKIKEPKNLTESYNNADIIVHVLSEDKMRELGFTDRKKDTWYLCRGLGNETSFNVSIAKDGSYWQIDVLDENFLQPYDYQSMIMKGNPTDFAIKVYHRVEELMSWLQNNGVIEGHNRGDYI